MNVCELCFESGQENCSRCTYGNPCLGCEDYDEQNGICTSNGGCSSSAASDNSNTKIIAISQK